MVGSRHTSTTSNSILSRLTSTTTNTILPRDGNLTLTDIEIVVKREMIITLTQSLTHRPNCSLL